MTDVHPIQVYMGKKWRGVPAPNVDSVQGAKDYLSLLGLTEAPDWRVNPEFEEQIAAGTWQKPHYEEKLTKTETLDQRVGAVISATNEKVVFLGYGKYVGDHKLPGHDLKNPKIVLDDGRVFWGCECWWGEEGRMKLEIENYKNAGAVIEKYEGYSRFQMN